MSKKPNFRERILMRNDARLKLQDFLSCIDGWPDGDAREFPNRMKGFSRAAVEQVNTFTPRSAKRIRIEVPSSARTCSVPSVIEQIKIDARLAVLKKEFFALLRLAAQNRPPEEQQLKALFQAIADPIHGLAYLSGARTPYHISAMSIEKAAGEALKDYLNLIAWCDPVHGLCESCGIMFILGKGKRRFCDECGKKRSSYQGRKDYLKQWQKENYQYGSYRNRDKKGVKNEDKESTKKGK